MRRSLVVAIACVASVISFGTPAVAGAASFDTAPVVRDMCFYGSDGWAVGLGKVYDSYDRYVSNEGKVVATKNGTTWYHQRVPAGLGLLRGVAFGSANSGVAVGESASAIYTKNGGFSWAKSAGITAGDSLNSVAWVSGSTYVAVGRATGSKGVTYRSTDGGANWTRTLQTTNGLVAVAMKGASGVAASSGSTAPYLRTADGGATWVKTTATWAGVNDLAFQGTRCWTFGAASSFYGKSYPSWSTNLFENYDQDGYVELAPPSNFIRASLATDGGGWVVGNWYAASGFGGNGWEGTAVIYRTLDSGTTWSKATTPLYNVDSVWCTSKRTAYLHGTATQQYGPQRFLRTTDGGTSWAQAGVTSTPMQLTVPTLSTASPTRGTAFYVSGYVKPDRAGYAYLYYYQKVNGSWVYRSRTAARLVDRGSYSSYKSAVKLASAGSWYVRARHLGSTSVAGAWSTPRYFSVR